MATYGPIGSEADVATRRDSAIAAGLGDHLPIGYWSGAIYRSAIRFAKPAWLDWTSITSATLTVYVSDFQHVGVRNSSIYVRRNAGTPWTKAAGTQDCESGFSGGNNTQAADLPVGTSDQVSFASGSAANAKKSINVTAIVQQYWASDVKPVFVFDPVGSGDYTELWAREHPGSYDPTLTIVYETNSPPTAPTLTAPAAGAVGVSVNPRFTWVHNDVDGDLQVAAEVEVYDAAGTTLLYTWQNPTEPYNPWLDAPVALTPGMTYQWRARTSDAFPLDWGAYSAKQSFAVGGGPVVTIAPTRVMVYDAVAKVPRLVVSWSSDKPQDYWQVTVPAVGYDSGLQAGPATSLTLPIALTDNVPVNVTVGVQSAGVAGSATRAFNPRFGLTVHRRDLTAGALPTSWISAVVDSVVPVGGADLRMQYGGSATATAVPAAWFDDLAQVPIGLRYLFWKALFIPSATQGPTLNKVTVTYTTGAVTPLTLDKWSTTRGGTAFVAPWKVSTDEYVYGTRSANADMRSAGGPSVLYSQPITLRKDRSYILTGLMKSSLDSGACFELVDSAGATINKGGGILIGANQPMRSGVLDDGVFVETILHATKGWFDDLKFDVVRYRTPVYKASGTEPEVVYVALKVNGAIGSQAWFDALKLEESTVATPWSPASIGAVVIDAGGVQVDGTKGGVLRYRATGGGLRDVIEGGTRGLKFGGDSGELYGEDTSLILASGFLGAGGVPATRGVMGPGNIELAAATPYIDFKADPAHDFDSRIIMSAPGVLEVSGVWKAVGLQRTGGAAFPTVGLSSGDRFYRTDLGIEYYWNGTVWVPLTAPLPVRGIQSGGPLAVTVGAVQYTATWQAVVFPLPYASAPRVFASSSSGSDRFVTHVRNVTTLGCDVGAGRIDNASGGTAQVNWVAIGTLA